MATSEMITDYKDWIQNRWANGTSLTDATDALFDSMNDLVHASSVAPTMDLPDPMDYYGTTPATTIQSQVEDLIAIDGDARIAANWDQPGTATNPLTIGVAEYEDDIYQLWLAKDSESGLTDALDDTVNGFLEQGSAYLRDKLFHEAQQRFLSSNVVFSSVYARWVLDKYDQLAADASKLTGDGRLAQLDKGATRAIEILKVAAQRKANIDALRAELALKKTSLVIQLEELQTKLVASINQNNLKDVVNLEKYNYVYDTTTSRWQLDNEEYKVKAFAALHGGLATTMSTSQSGWEAMSDFEQTAAIASTAVSMGAGLTSILKNFDIF